MTRATLDQPTQTTAQTPCADTMPGHRHDLASRPNDVLQEGAITRSKPQRSNRRASATAGAGLLAMSVLSAFGYLVAVKGLVVPGNAARTARNVAVHQNEFRLGIVSLYLVAGLDVVVAWALYRVFKPVSDALSKVAAWLRVAYAGVFIVAISQLTEALGHHGQALGHINTFTDVWDAGLVLFGLGLFTLASLAYRSGYVPKVLGIVLAFAGFGYVFDTAMRILVRGSSSDVSTVTGIGEFAFALWLVFRGRTAQLPVTEPAFRDLLA